MDHTRQNGSQNGRVIEDLPLMKYEYQYVQLFFWGFKYDLEQKYYTLQVRPDRGSNS